MVAPDASEAVWLPSAKTSPLAERPVMLPPML
jgi:hypothetical protein